MRSCCPRVISPYSGPLQSCSYCSIQHYDCKVQYLHIDWKVFSSLVCTRVHSIHARTWQLLRQNTTIHLLLLLLIFNFLIGFKDRLYCFFTGVTLKRWIHYIVGIIGIRLSSLKSLLRLHLTKLKDAFSFRLNEVQMLFTIKERLTHVRLVNVTVARHVVRKINCSRHVSVRVRQRKHVVRLKSLIVGVVILYGWSWKLKIEV